MTMFRNFTKARAGLENEFRLRAYRIHTRKWQGQYVGLRPDMVSFELMNVTMQVLLGTESLVWYRDDLKPNLPWADDHFEERVCGAPLNPGIQWQNWPWASSANNHMDEGLFNHTYMERLWPRYAGKIGLPIKTKKEFGELIYDPEVPERPIDPNLGIWSQYGDLSSLVDKLAWEPDTRQAYIPLYFPEDTGAEGRMPCTLGYQFLMRNEELHLYYPMRSCDFVRHWADDCYLAVRLLIWMLQECRSRNSVDWHSVSPGTLTMHMTSLHVFANDAIKMGLKA